MGYPKRIGLSDVSRTVLGLGESIYLDDPITEVRADVFRLAGDVGPVSRVVVVEYRSGVPLEVVDVNPETGIGDLISNTTSFGADGDAGLASLCDLAASVPIHHVTHADAADAVALISTR